jgi:hypothetical protein
MTTDELLTAILRGDHDDILPLINDVVSDRRKTIGRQLARSLTIGDRVRFTSIRPQYLIGSTAMVTGRKGAKLMVRLERAQGRFGTSEISVPPQCVELA